MSNSEYFQPGTTLKRRYQIIKLLGEGSFGQTYLAEDTYETNSQGTVVVKKLKSHINNDVWEVARKKFISEAFSLRKLGYKHSQIPTLFDFFYKDDDFFLVQEYIEGINLGAKLNLSLDRLNKVIFDETEATNLLIQLLSILQCLHENQTIHLDIKPLNIIWREKDNKYFLIDFGCVKDISSYILINDHLYSSVILGTPHYMPKEQSMGNPRYNSDIYALGIVVIQAVTGLNCIDFKYDNNGHLIWHSQANISYKLRKILDKMISVDYHENYRYQTVLEVLKDLKKLKKENSIHAVTKLLPSNRKISLTRYFRLFILFLGLSSIMWSIWKIWLKPRIWETSNKVSIGEQVYFFSGKQCTYDFQNKQYNAAKQCFKKVMAQNYNNPEVAIYYNNSLALSQKKSPFYLAVTVPIFRSNKITQEILRGIAHSQHIFNQNKGVDGKLLVIAIADDGNQVYDAKNIAKQLRDENLISGVIGHHSTTANSFGIQEYKQQPIPIISTISVSENLQQEDTKNQLFTTAISDENAIKMLAQYITKVTSAKKIAVLYEPDKKHSESAKISLIENLDEIEVLNLEQLNTNKQNFFHLDTIRNVKEAKHKINYLLENNIEHIVLFPDTNNLNSIKYISLAVREIPQAEKIHIYGINSLYNYDVISDPILDNLKGLKSIILSLAWARENSQAEYFVEQFEKYWGDNSIINWRTANSYDATQVFIQSFKSDRYQRQSILNYLRNNFNIDSRNTSGQDIIFDSEGNRIAQPILVELALDDNKQLRFKVKCSSIEECES